MDLWTVLEERIKQHGVRVEERRYLLTQLKADHETAGASVAECKEALVLRVENVAARLKGTLRA